jgi:hypothetical protein
MFEATHAKRYVSDGFAFCLFFEATQIAMPAGVSAGMPAQKSRQLVGSS